MDSKLKLDLEYCRKIEKKYGTSYYFVTKFFSQKQKLATYALYAFFRIPDEIVDSSETKDANKSLRQWIANWQMAFKYKTHDDPVLNAASWVFQEYQIPYEYSEAFLNAMLMDLTKKEYKNYEELEKYMYGSSGVVGIMMSYIIGFSDAKALDYAKDLGYAMQVTNFLRDIKEDLLLRDRVYMPKDELDSFGLAVDDFKKWKINDLYIDFMKFQIDRARNLYNSSKQGVELLDKSGRLAVSTAIVLYSAILTQIEKNKYDVFTKRARTSFLRKIMLFIFKR